MAARVLTAVLPSAAIAAVCATALAEGAQDDVQDTVARAKLTVRSHGSVFFGASDGYCWLDPRFNGSKWCVAIDYAGQLHPPPTPVLHGGEPMAFRTGAPATGVRFGLRDSHGKHLNRLREAAPVGTDRRWWRAELPRHIEASRTLTVRADYRYLENGAPAGGVVPFYIGIRVDPAQDAPREKHLR